MDVLGKNADGVVIVEPESVSGREIVMGFMHPGTPDDWTLHPAEMRDIGDVPHIVAAHWSKPVES